MTRDELRDRFGDEDRPTLCCEECGRPESETVELVYVGRGLLYCTACAGVTVEGVPESTRARYREVAA